MGVLPDIDDVNKLDESKIMRYISELCHRFEKCRISLKLDEVDDLIHRLSDSYFSCRDYRHQICGIYVKKEIIKTAQYFLFMLGCIRPPSDQFLDLLYTFLVNFSELSEKFARGIYSCSLLILLIDNCLDKNYLSDIKNHDIINILTSCVNVIHNIFRHPENKLTHRVVEFKEILLYFIKQNSTARIGVLSMLTLAYIVEEDEIYMLDEGSNSVERIFYLIKKILDTNTSQAGFTIEELVNGVRSISFNDKMKERIAEIGGIPILLEIIAHNINKVVTEEAVAIALGVIWNLCFIPAIRTKLIEEYQIENHLKKIQYHKYEKIEKNSNGIYFEIRRTKKKAEGTVAEFKSDSKEDHFDVFISYAWANKEKISEIKSWLEKSSMKVWLDDEQMYGSTLESMAKGIENSKIFIIGISSSYAKSENCRSEAEYAYRQRKPIIPLIMEFKYKPDSWLGLIMGMKLYFEFSERRDPAEVVNGLVRSVRKCLSCNVSAQDVEQKLREENCFKQLDSWVPVRSADQVKVLDKVRCWSCDEVMEWLNQADLRHLKKKFVEVDGSLLAVMVHIRYQSPEYFNDTLKTEYGLKFIDVMKFHRALNDLESN